MSKFKSRLDRIEGTLFGDELRWISVNTWTTSSDTKPIPSPLGLHALRYTDETHVSIEIRVCVPHELRSIMESCRNLSELRKMAEKHNCTVCPNGLGKPNEDIWN